MVEVSINQHLVRENTWVRTSLCIYVMLVWNDVWSGAELLSHWRYEIARSTRRYTAHSNIGSFEAEG